MNRDGSNGHVIAGGVLDDQIAWAPDGQSIAANAGGVVAAYSLRGGRPVGLIGHAAQPAWVGR